MLRDYEIRHKNGTLIGIFRDNTEKGAKLQAFFKASASASKYSSMNFEDLIAIRLGIL